MIRYFPTLIALIAVSSFSQTLQTLPAPDPLGKSLRSPARPVRVYEPHLEKDGMLTEVIYLGYPATRVFDLFLGKSWRAKGADVELRALDGYVSRIDAQKFATYDAYLVHARQDGSAFTVDNHAQHERDVALGPYYLVWDNLKSPELLTQGASNWPYQVTRIGISHARRLATMPDGMAPRWSEAAALTHKHCLSCHQIDGYGGDKVPIDLVEAARTRSRDTFIAWLLDPRAERPQTMMPALLHRSSAPYRLSVAQQIYEYLEARGKLADRAP